MEKSYENMIKLIGLESVSDKIDYEILETSQCNGYKRELIQYFVHGRKNLAFLLIPDKEGKCPAILINHQHNRERNLGKSEGGHALTSERFDYIIDWIIKSAK